MNKSLIFGLQREILAALGCVALMSPGCVGDSSGSSSSEGTTGTSKGTDGGSSSSTDGSATTPTSGSSTEGTGSSTTGTGSSSTEGTGSSGTTGTGSSGTEGTGSSSTEGSGSSGTTGTDGTGTSGTEGTGSSTGGDGICDPAPPPIEGKTQEFVCFKLPEGVDSCAECDEACSLYNVSAAITQDPDFCTAEGLILQCGPDVDAQPMSCCFWASYAGVVCEGRPLIVDGEVRAAPVCSRGDWLAEPQVYGERLDPRTRGALASAWAEDARMEHASVAAFARLVLHLMAVAAPAELVAGAQAALADEIEHARLCFSLASAYQGHAQGPGPLPIEGALAGVPTLTELAVAAVVEGCVGETIAASIARVSAEGARDPAVRAALKRIAADESRHAAFSWRLVRWILEVGDSSLRSAVREAFEIALQRPPKPRKQASGVDRECWTAHGRLSSEVEDAVIRETLCEVIEPCSRTLLGQVSAATVRAQLVV